VVDTQREIETKFDVAPDFVIGDLADLATPSGTIEASTVELLNVYYDTTDNDLLRSLLTLRRRTGGADSGWHLKIPGAGFRTELRWPLVGHDTIPDQLRRWIQPFTHGTAIHPTIQLRVVRTRYRINDLDGTLRLELADDEVRATGLRASVSSPRWREVEVELGPSGSRDDLEQAATLLTGRGAYLSPSMSKLERALAGAPVSAHEPGTAAAMLADYITAQCDAVTAGHFAISIKPFEGSSTVEPHEAVHQTRVAIRRLRAALRTFAPLFDTAPAARLESELSWFAAELGEVRDREVLRARLARAVDDLPAYLVVGPVAERIDQVLLGELQQHSDALLQTMRDSRYHALIDDLAQWRARPPFAEAASRPARVLIEHVTAAQKKLSRRMKRAATKQSPDEELHSARKAGKRARYAAEAAAPVLGKQAHILAKAAANLQTLLGEHQDSIVATELLRRIADQVADEGANAFTYGILVADQRRSALESARAARNA
jgi:CHAD domain-containing protein